MEEAALEMAWVLGRSHMLWVAATIGSQFFYVTLRIVDLAFCGKKTVRLLLHIAFFAAWLFFSAWVWSGILRGGN